MTRGLIALAGVVVGLALAAAPAVAVQPPGAGYVWAQPGCVHVANPCTEPPAWVPIGPAAAYRPVAVYHWAQPGTAPVTTADAQPPAWVPIA
jgi:hypothetical protein